ncbi:zinc finger CCHC domain-containing protein 3-like [Gastrophryne carolinensis]
MPAKSRQTLKREGPCGVVGLTSATLTWNHSSCLGQLSKERKAQASQASGGQLQNAWSRGAPSFSPGLHYTGQAFKRRNVVRFKNKGAKEDLPDRRHVIRELLCNQMGFTPADILAVINLPDRQGYDISFKLMASLDRFWASVTKFRGTEGWDQFILIPVSKPGTVSVNILFWNESVPPQDIVIWLRRHCDMVSDLTKCLDDDGIWTGGWRVLVKLRQHSNVTLHLPNSFFIGRERGVCFYAGQPRLCFKCGKAGHVAGVCTVVKCNLCGEIGHTSAMCTNVRCNLCVFIQMDFSLIHKKERNKNQTVQQAFKSNGTFIQ